MANILVMFYVCAEIDYAQVEATLKSHRGTGCDQRQIESRTINYTKEQTIRGSLTLVNWTREDALKTILGCFDLLLLVFLLIPVPNNM